MKDKATIRKDLLRKRKDMKINAHALIDTSIESQILKQKSFIKSKRIAAYYGVNGEFDPMPILHVAHQMGKECFLPVIHPFKKGGLLFVRWFPKSKLGVNQFQIPEPIFKKNQICAPQFLHLILIPLLGFNKQCYRIGMGGGYYDRTLEFRKRRKNWRGPKFFGLGYEYQLENSFKENVWDIRLDRIFTGEKMYFC